jgi:hypothetical protein
MEGLNRTGTDEYAVTTPEHKAVVTGFFIKGATKDQQSDGTAGSCARTDIVNGGMGPNQPAFGGTFARPIPRGRGNRPS